MRKIYSAMVVVAAIIAISASSAVAADFACPSHGTPAPGSRIKGRLEVNGVCILIRVRVDGGVTVERTGALSLQSSTVNGGIAVVEGGELDLNAITPSAGVPTGTSSTVHGGIVAVKPFDVDFWTARVSGGITVDQTSGSSFPIFCGNDVDGKASFSNFALAATIGGGTVPLLGLPCGGNIFNGTVSLTNLTAAMGGNTIRGDLLCSNSTVMVTAPNMITGKNTCY